MFASASRYQPVHFAWAAILLFVTISTSVVTHLGMHYHTVPAAEASTFESEQTLATVATKAADMGFISIGEAAAGTAAVGETPQTKQLEVPCLMQFPDLPTGCEATALTNTLLYYGMDLQLTTIVDNWLPLSETDFVHAFLGDPRYELSNSTMAPCITSTANKYLISEGSTLRAKDISFVPFENLLSLVGEGYPVIVWSPLNLAPVDEPYYTQEDNGFVYGLYESSHCLVISGYDLEKNLVYVSDSILGKTEFDIDAFAAGYEALGSQAVLIRYR